MLVPCTFVTVAGNVQRSTPGRFLLMWAVLMTALLLFAWRVHLHRDEYFWNEYPTALGDRNLYTSLSSNDFYRPALLLKGESQGHFRRMVKPVSRDDAKMRKVGRDASNRVFVYSDSKQPKRLFLKVAEDRYIEFGERKFWPEYQPPKAIPFTPSS
jgi:hypothetical protein